MTGAIPRDSAGRHLPALGYELRNHSDILVIDHQGLISTEPTDFAAEHRPAPGGSLLIITAVPIGPCAGFPLCHRLDYLTLRYVFVVLNPENELPRVEEQHCRQPRKDALFQIGFSVKRNQFGYTWCVSALPDPSCGGRFCSSV
jgi:hypothetical protein